MSLISFILISIGIFGILWTVFGSAFISLIFKIFKKSKIEMEKNSSKIEFEILIAAYNEEINLPITLNSLEMCTANSLLKNENINVSVRVGLDHCTDSTLEIVKKFQNNKNLNLNYFENKGQRGKWFIVRALIESSTADWVSLTDCGVIWNENLIKKSSKFFNQKDLICIAPSYLPFNSGLLETMYWRFEQLLRVCENNAGGSIMVHGPTVFYRRSALITAIKLLGEKHWINDDVAIPLVLKNYNKSFQIKYFADWSLKAWVLDKGVVSNVDIELKRRRRILIGNLQCAVEIILPKFSLFSLTSLTSIRLIFKLLWAYWLTFLMSGFLLLLISNFHYFIFIIPDSTIGKLVSILMILITTRFVIKSNYIHRLFMAYISGLQINKALKVLKDPKKFVWS